MDRRRFTHLSALLLGSASMRLRAAQQPAGGKPVGYAAVGLGNISDIFMRACAASQATGDRSARITALVTGHPDEKGKRYAAQYGIPESSIYTYESFDRIRNNPDVDAVYIGLPNSMHREYTVRAAAAGKHVLCEKPMAISSAECREMIAACRKANRLLMVAYRCHFEQSHLRAKAVLDAGTLGPLEAFEGSFGANSKPGQWRLQRALAGGGSLLDVGIYPLNSMQFFAGEVPAAFTAIASTRDKGDPRFAEMEQTLAWTARFPSRVVGNGLSSYGANLPSFLRIHCQKGTLELTQAFSYKDVHLHAYGMDLDQTTSPVETVQFQAEAEHFARCIRTGTPPRTPGEMGLTDMVAMEEIYRAAGTPIA